MQVIPLRAAPAGPAVELLRCRSCTRSHWCRDGSEISRTDALGSLRSEAVLPAEPVTARPAPGRKPAAAPSRAAELRDLLAGWQVLGS